MSEAVRCSSCGAELSQDAIPQGLCAACLLKLGLSSPNVPAAELPLPESPSKSPRRRIRWFRSVLAPLGVIFTVLAAFIFRPSEPSEPRMVVRFSLPLQNSDDFAVSPDGLRIAFTTSNAEGQRSLSGSFSRFLRGHASL